MSSTKTVHRTLNLRPKVTPEFPLTEENVKDISARLDEPAWMAERRLKAFDAYRSIPMPNLSDEPWRRTDIRTLPADQLTRRPADEVPVDPGLLNPLVDNVHDRLLVIHHGHSPIVEGTLDLVDDGVIAVDWTTAVQEYGDILKDYLGTIVPEGEGKFSALAAAMAENGVLVYVPPGIEVQRPLRSIFWAPGAQAAFFSRILLVVGEGATLTYVHEIASPTVSGGESTHCGIVEVHVGEGARLTLVELQNLGLHVWNFTHEGARVDRDGYLEWIYSGVGSHLSKNFIKIDLVEEGAESRLSAFSFSDGMQHLDHDTRQNHLAQHTTSDLLFKCALKGRSRSVWRGMIFVAPEAQKADGYQANRNLILDSRARVDSIPGLEILADDVRCTHGSTVGQLEEEPIFYLMSRGLPREEAERLMVEGFFSPIIERIPFESLRARLHCIIRNKMEISQAEGF